MTPATRDQHARQIGQFGAQPDQPAAAHQAAHQQRGQQPRVDIAAGQHDADPPTAEPLGFGQQRRDAGGAGAFDDQFLRSISSSTARFELPLVDEPDCADQGRDDAAGQLPRLLDRDALGQGRALGRQPGSLPRKTRYIDG